MNSPEQTNLPLFNGIKEPDPNIAYLVAVLQGRDWTTAREIMAIVYERTAVTWHDRKVRELAAASKGFIAGGQKGYKLVENLTAEEFNHWRNWMKSQADEMTRRVIEADKVFYKRQPVATGKGIL